MMAAVDSAMYLCKAPRQAETAPRGTICRRLGGGATGAPDGFLSAPGPVGCGGGFTWRAAVARFQGEQAMARPLHGTRMTNLSMARAIITGDQARARALAAKVLESAAVAAERRAAEARQQQAQQRKR